ncbi:MAG: cytochrome C [Cyclobacteriaceae bacterium]|nr:cytochrome C [Cyclobacteriaceae bacterium]MCB0499062.1 cytochrome C [Cyclobacteriaceae bacterium]MCB9238338.1 cytochrome C [Flammeovirgaceae bacterium]MCO5272020.1 cytochrome C [Cyclobacteriaceae bacterium]MCW5902944.1 cytochrome C [Cyclobacteriaceae bacterium]
MEDKRIIKVFMDEEARPFAEFAPPVKFILDTTKIPDGKHTLRIVAKSTSGVEGTKTIPFEVRNGPSISVVGLKSDEVVEDQIPITINAYGSEGNDVFVVRGSETPKGIPSWVWALVIAFVGFALFYLIMFWEPGLYKSFV